jgi:hypothetical protein
VRRAERSTIAALARLNIPLYRGYLVAGAHRLSGVVRPVLTDENVVGRAVKSDHECVLEGIP